jgi:tRNA threonylcarbamoyladenosine biosynthesis protein TsaE
MKFVSHSVEETENIAIELSSHLKGNEVIAFFGGLGMGKTAFTRGLMRGLDFSEGVQSPTFSLVNQYNGKFPVYHFDMYRINTYDDLYSTGFFDYLDTGILIIEWSENIENVLPDNYISIEINKGTNENERIINIEGIDY